MNAKKQYLPKCLILFLIVSTCIATASADPHILTVGEGKDHLNISDALSMANDGSIILVSDGIYNENIVVDKKVTILSENGSASTTVQALTPHNHIFNISASNVTISGFNVTGATNYTGILIDGASNFNISNNIISESYAGIYVENSLNGLLADNVANSNYQGIILNNSINCTLFNNQMILNDLNFEVYGTDQIEYIHDINTSNLINNRPIYYWSDRSDDQIPSDAGIVYIINCSNITVEDVVLSNNWDGITLVDANNCTIRNNIVSESGTGIHTLRSDFTTIYNNEISGNSIGIAIENSNNTIISNNNAGGNIAGIAYIYSDHTNLISNTISDNALFGIYVISSNDGYMSDNVANSNLIGIQILHSNNNELRRNTANSNSLAGIDLTASNNNTFYGNTANNNVFGIAGFYLSNVNSECLNNEQFNVPARRNIFENIHSYSTNAINSISISGISTSAYGVRITNSDNNTLSDTNAINNDFDFYSDHSSNSTVNDLTLTNRQAKLSFITDEHVLSLKGNDSNSVSLSGKVNVNGYISLSRIVTALEDSMPLQISYSDSGMSNVGESSIHLYSLNGSQWNKVENSILNTNSNYVSATITEAEENPSIHSPVLSYEATLALFKDPEPSRSSGSLPQSLKDSTMTDLPISNKGEITRDTVVKSKNSDATLTLYKGTKAIDASGNPVNTIRVTPFSYGPAGIPADATDHGLYFKFEPSGTTFSQDVMITMEFNPEDFEGRTPVIYTYTSEDGWIALETTVDWENGRATAMISHFSFYALFGTEAGPVKEVSFEPASETTEPVTSEGNHTEESTDEKGLGFIPWVVAIVLVIGLGIVYGTKKKKEGGL